MSNIYDVGDKPIVSAEFSKVDVASGISTPINPTSVSVKLRSPTGVETTYSSGFENPSAGKYFFECPMLVLGDEGSWLYRWVATGAVTAAEEGRFVVRRSGFAAP